MKRRDDAAALRYFLLGFVVSCSIATGCIIAVAVLPQSGDTQQEEPLVPRPVQHRDILYSTAPLDRRYSHDAVQMKVEATIDWINTMERNTNGGAHGSERDDQ